MTQLWQPGTQYNLGDEVVYDGVRYRIIQAHRSQGDWTPAVTPALWGRMQEPAHTTPAPAPVPAPGGYGCPPPQQHYGPGPQNPQQQPPKYDDHKHDSGNHSDSDDDGSNKKKILGFAAGGILAGAAAVGAGLLYKHHKDEKEDKEGWNKWYAEAKKTTDVYFTQGTNAPCYWLLTHGKKMPQYAIETGKEHSWTLHICRAYFDGGVLLGKASDAFEKGGVIGYKHKEHAIDTFEVLIGDMSRLKWVETSGKFNIHSLNGARPVQGGHENDGTPLYVVRAQKNGVWHPGKASQVLDGAYIPYEYKEQCVDKYEVLCYK